MKTTKTITMISILLLGFLLTSCKKDDDGKAEQTKEFIVKTEGIFNNDTYINGKKVNTGSPYQQTVEMNPGDILTVEAYSCTGAGQCERSLIQILDGGNIVAQNQCRCQNKVVYQYK